MAVIMMAVVPAQLGLTNLLLRETASATTAADPGRLRATWQWASWVALLATIGTLLVLLVLGPTVLARSAVFRPEIYAVGLLLLPALVVTNLGEAILQGLGRTAKAIFPGYVLKPLLFLVFVAAGVVLGVQMDAVSVMSLQLIAFTAGAGLVAWMLIVEGRKRLSSEGTAPRNGMWRSTLAFFFMHSIWVVLNQTDIVVLGAISSSHDVGLYRVASTGAGFVFLSLSALTAIISERISSLHQLGDTRRLQQLMSIGGLAAFGLAAPLTILFLVAGEPIISTIFGPEFAPASHILAILAVGQLVHVACGYAPALLGMTSAERTLVWILLPAAGLNVALNLLLVPAMGAQGAAIGTATAVASQAIATWWLVRRRYHIDTSAWCGIVFLARTLRSGSTR